MTRTNWSPIHDDDTGTITREAYRRENGGPVGIVNDLIGDEFDVSTGDRNGKTPKAPKLPRCEYDECGEEFIPKRKGQRFHTQRCAALFNARREYGPTGKPAKVVVEVDQAVAAAAIWIEPPARPLQPFTDAEITTIADFAGLDAAKVRGIAWLTALKLEVSA